MLFEIQDFSWAGVLFNNSGLELIISWQSLKDGNVRLAKFVLKTSLTTVRSGVDQDLLLTEPYGETKAYILLSNISAKFRSYINCTVCF